MPRSKKRIKLISLGGGLQSTTVTLLSILEEIERADAAIFADTGWERQATYDNVNMLKEFAKPYDFPIYTVHGKQSVRDQAMNPDYDFINMPVFTESPSGRKGQTKRQCTDHYKLRPIRKFMNEHWGRVHFEQWIGISMDEALRQRSPDVKYIDNRYPLIELKWDRQDCKNWLTEKGFGIPTKSSCIGCPYHSHEVWKSLTEEEWKDVIEVDEHIRDIHKGKKHRIKPRKWHDDQLPLLNIELLDSKHDDPTKGLRQCDMENYLYQGRIPLREVKDDDGTEQYELFPSLERNECRGLCFL